MGAYLSQPNTVKCSGDGVGASRLPLPYGFSAMQGWRVSMEVRREGPIGWRLQGGNPTEKGSGGMGSSPGEGPKREAVAAAAVCEATARAGPGPRATCGARGPCDGGQLGGERSAMWGEAPSAN